MKSPMKSLISKRLFMIRRGTDGVDKTFDVVYRENGTIVASFHYWYAKAEARRQARQLTAALNAFYRNGGLLHLSGFLRTHRMLHEQFCELITHAPADPASVASKDRRFA
ncbi:MAG: hypothetical protein R3B90_00135 [Planctomycetaceae bacterium]